MTTKRDVYTLLSNTSDSAKINISHSPGKDMITVSSKQELINQKFPALIGQDITVTEAAKKYAINRRTILEWITKGYIKVIKSGYQMTIDNADMAYCADVYLQRKNNGIGFGLPLLDENGLPYTIKHPNLSAYRRRRKAN
jgi:excisionase family DNA binding protein